MAKGPLKNKARKLGRAFLKKLGNDKSKGKLMSKRPLETDVVRELDRMEKRQDCTVRAFNSTEEGKLTANNLPTVRLAAQLPTEEERKKDEGSKIWKKRFNISGKIKNISAYKYYFKKAFICI